MNNLKWILTGIIIAIIIFGSGYYSGYRTGIKPIPNPSEPIITPIISKPIERPKDLSCEQTKNLLYCYDNDPFQIDWTIIKQTKTKIDVNITGNLCERKFEQSATLPIIQSNSGNFKLGLGFTLGTMATIGTGYIIYKIIDHFN